MNDLGITLAWLAVQVSLVLAPGLILYARAARRGPAAGASIATLSLGLVVAMTIAAFLPGVGRGPRTGGSGRLDEASPSIAPAAPAGASIATGRDGPIRPPGEKRPFAGWRVAWARLERGAAEPAARCRPWAGTLAMLVLTGTAAGLLRLAIGLGAVVVCRRRGRPVDDPGMVGLLDELRRAIGCRAVVELREVADLVGPATAGWRRPVILMPEDWRSWDDSERRAVLAHELAHVVRGDYAAGLLARLALALNGYHPMVRWMAGQLRLQQELAADAMGARHAGGRAGYLVALSRLALRQDGRSPCWPARAFLPARGTLIRRITMLRDETQIGTMDGPWMRARRLAMTASLVGVTAAVMSLRGPARGGEAGGPAVGEASAASPASLAVAPTSPPLYGREGMSGVIVLRPAAAARHAAIDRLARLLGDRIRSIVSDVTGHRIDTARPGFVRLGAGDLEWITLRIGFSRGGKDKDGKELHRIMIGHPAFRTVAPFDWLGFLRQWGCEVTEVRDAKQVYYKATGTLMKAAGPDTCLYLPDDRTLVIDQETFIRKLAGGEAPPLPDYLRGPDWERACRGLLAVAINNQDAALAKDYDLGRPDDAVALSLLKGVDHWTFSVDDADAIVLRGAAACVGIGPSEAIARALESLLKKELEPLEREVEDVKPGTAHERVATMMKAFLANLRVEHADRAVALKTGGFGTLADFTAVVEDEFRSADDLRHQQDAPKPAKP